MVSVGGPRRWVVVADSPFLPARGGGEREHLGFVETLLDAGVLAALVVPVDENPTAIGRTDDLEAIKRLVAPAPVLLTPRRRGPVSFLSRRPYVVASRPVPPDLVDRVRAAAPDADALVAYSHKVSEIGRVLATALGLPAVLRHHNLEGPYHRALAAAAPPPRSWVLSWEASRIEHDERRLERSSWLNGIADISETDARTRAARSIVPVVHVPSFALGPRSSSALRSWEPPDRPRVIFLGALDVGTNHDALTWFAEHVWPLVRRSRPDAEWQIVGRRPTELVKELVARTPGTVLLADVVDPVEHLRAASVAINPTVSGSGVNIKLVEYLSVGLPVVSTQRGMAGLGLVPDRDLLVADDADGFARHVLDLLGPTDRAIELAASGQATAATILDVHRSLATISELLVGRGQPGRPEERPHQGPLT